MIPILYDETETSFTTNGIGRLVDAIECTVEEERNGIYELFLSYPITGALFSELQKSRIILAVPADGKRSQPFRIYKIEKPINGICSIYAEHISYQLNHIPVMPFTGINIDGALNGLVQNSAQENPFSVWTDKGTTGTYTLAAPMPFRAALGGVEGSILDVFGSGEYEFDRWTVRLWNNRGQDTGVTIRYGKDLIDLKQEESIAETITGVCPYWIDSESGEIVTLPEKSVFASTAENFPYKRTAVIDFSGDFETQPTVAQLRARAEQYITANKIGIPKVSISISFVPLWQTDGASMGVPKQTLVFPARVENGVLTGVSGTVDGDTASFTGTRYEVVYERFKVLERVNLCDTVKVFYSGLGVSVKAEVVKTNYNVLLDRYNSIEIGDPQTSLADTIVAVDSTIQKQNTETTSFVRKMINHQTELITGGLGGYVVFTLNDQDQPEEILIMDTPYMDTAVNVIRMNQSGIGFSSSGYEGPFESAWTIDGSFNADFITAGTMLANRIYGGTLTLGGLDNQNGLLQIRNSSGTLTGWVDNEGYHSQTHVTIGTDEEHDLESVLDAGNLRFTADGENSLVIAPLYTTSTDPVAFTGFMVYKALYFVTGSGGNVAFRFGGLDGWGDYGADFYFGLPVSMTAGLTVTGTKSRLAKTEEYGDRLLYCYETPSPLFGDVGEGQIDESGLCYVFLDPVFAETITTTQYQVFIQAYGESTCYVTERKPGYFVVKGEPGAMFGWEIKAKQADFDQLRLEKQMPEVNTAGTDYGEEAANFLKDLEDGRITA